MQLRQCLNKNLQESQVNDLHLHLKKYKKSTKGHRSIFWGNGSTLYIQRDVGYTSLLGYEHCIVKICSYIHIYGFSPSKYKELHKNKHRYTRSE